MAKSKVRKSAVHQSGRPTILRAAKQASRKTAGKRVRKRTQSPVAKLPVKRRPQPAPRTTKKFSRTTKKQMPKPKHEVARAEPVRSDHKPAVSLELDEKVKELLRLAREQGYLTYNDINDALPENIVTADDLDEIYIKLRNLEVEIVDQAEVDRVKQPEREEEEDKSRLDILDDPVRMYLKQMGQVPLLTREQEVEISKRIESAENELKRIIYSFGFAGKEHIALAEKLISEPPKERFDRVIVDKKIESREEHLRDLRKLVKTVRTLDAQVDDKYAKWQYGSQRQSAGAGNQAPSKRWIANSRKAFPNSTSNRRSSKKWPWWRRISTTKSN